MSYIKDITLAPSGKMKIDWVERNMPLLCGIAKDFEKTLSRESSDVLFGSLYVESQNNKDVSEATIYKRNKSSIR